MDLEESENFVFLVKGQLEREVVFNEQCFFCSKNYPSDKLIEEQLPVDPQQLTDDNDKKEDDEGQDTTYLLRRLCGYLKIQLDLDLLDNQLEKDGKSLCRECRGTANKLTNLFDELETTRLWIKHYLSLLTQKFSEETGEEVGHPNDLKKLIKDKCSSVLMRDPLVILKDVLKTTEDLDLVTSPEPPSPPEELPISPESPPLEKGDEDDCIVLDGVNKPIKTRPKSPSTSQNTCPLCLKLFSSNLRGHKIAHHPEQLLLQHKMDHVTLPQFKQICHQVSRRKRPISQTNLLSGNPHGCIYCSMEYSYFRLGSLHSHMFDSHMNMLEAEVIKIQEKLPSIPQPTYLPSSFPQPEETPSTSAGPPAPKRRKRIFQPVYCQICNVKLASSQNLTRHMKTVHKNLKFTAIPIQIIIPPEVPPSPPSPPLGISIPSTITMEACEDDEEQEEIFQEEEEEDHFGWASKIGVHHVPGHVEQQQNQVQVVRGHQCPYCDRVLADVSRLRLHTSNMHTEQLLLQYKEDHVGLEEFKTICNDFLRLHRRELEVVGGGGSGEWNRRGKNVACLHCDMVYSNAQYLKFHMIGEHQDLVARELGELQKGV